MDRQTFLETYKNLSVFSLTDMRTIDNKSQTMQTATDAVGLEKALLKYDDEIYRMAYSKEEADSIGLDYHDYRDAKWENLSFPCYVLFEDNWVGLCLYIVRVTSHISVITALGERVVDAPRNKEHTNKQIKSYFDLNNKPASLTSRRLGGMTKSIMIARLMSAGCNVQQIEQYFANDPTLRRKQKILKIMKKKEVKAMASKMAREALRERGIDPDFVIDMTIEALEMIKAKKDTRSFVTLIQETADWTGFKDKETETTTDTLELIDYNKDLKTLTESKKTAKLTHEAEVEVNE